MRQAIQTRFIGPTNHRGSRIVATADAGKVTVAWDHALGIEENHTAAARALATKLAAKGYGWIGGWVGGGLPGGGYCFVVAADGRADFTVEGVADATV